MLLNDHKIQVCKTLDFCIVFNLNAQMQCQEIFQTLNRVWNELHSSSGDDAGAVADSIKFRKLMQLVLDRDRLQKLLEHPSLQNLADLSPPIHNDAVLGRPYNPEMDEILPDEVYERATNEHIEFRKYLARIRENFNSENVREFRNKLCRLLYLVRSNMAHGSKANYQGSQRNETISKCVYYVLLEICNFILDNGLYRIAAYGDLRTTGTLYEPLILRSNGAKIDTGIIDGELLKLEENTSTFNPTSEFSKVSVEILELLKAEDFTQIDLVECMPRSLVPYYTDAGDLKGFAWVYSSSINLRNSSGLVHSYERHAEIKNKATAFFYALIALRNKFTSVPVPANSQTKMYGKLFINFSTTLSFERGGDNHVLTSPHASELIAYIDELDQVFTTIFSHYGEIMPYTKKIMLGIDQVKFDRPDWFKNYSEGVGDPDAKDAYNDMVVMISEVVAGWLCTLLGDDDADLWQSAEGRSET